MQTLRPLLILILTAFFVASCASSEKYLQKGQYEKAITKSVKKLRKDPGNDKELHVLKEAYTKANTFDMDRISFLEKEGRAENYVEIYSLYQRLDRRQNSIKTLPTSVMNEFEITDYDDELIASKEQAAEISYQRGIEYLSAGDRASARMAFREFERVRSIYPDYKDVLSRMEEAQFLGTNQVLFVIENNSEVLLPERFDEELRKIALSELNGPWIQYSVFEDEEMNYDYFIVLDIREINISSERVDTEKYSESAEIQDGTNYVLDENGNVKKDSLGNDIRVPNMATVKAEVLQTKQWKQAEVAGTLDYVDLRTEQLVKTENLGVLAEFEHISADFIGDERALTTASLDMIDREPARFPSDEVMLMDAANLLKDQAKQIIFSNRDLLRSTGY